MVCDDRAELDEAIRFYRVCNVKPESHLKVAKIAFLVVLLGVIALAVGSGW